MPGDFDTVKERVDIAQIIGAYVPLKKAGRIYKALCPFHGEKTPSFTVDPDRRTYKCFGCLPPGSLVKTAQGPRRIEEIAVGDLVYAGDGRLHRVLITHEHMFAGQLVKLVCSPFEIPVLLTPNHKVPVIRPRSERIERVPADSIRPQNYLLYPAVERTGGQLDWSPRPSWFGRRGKRPKPLPPKVDVNLFAQWLGWYLARGSVSNKGTVRFSLGGHEKAIADRLRELTALLFGEELRMSPSESRVELWFCHALLARWLKHHCGDGAKNKCLPECVWGWNAPEQWALFYALVLGDGARNRGGDVATWDFVAQPSWRLSLASPRLIDDVRDLLVAHGVIPSLTESGRSDGRMSWHLIVPADVRDQWTQERPLGVPLAVRIRTVERVPYDGTVYNLTVDQEHTYLTMSGTVCNCGEGGDVFTFLEKKEGLSRGEALERLAREAGVELTRRRPEEREQHQRLYAAHEAAYFYFRQALRGLAQGKLAATYLEKRGIRPDTIERFGLGYAPDLRDGLLKYLRKKGFTDDEAVHSGVIVRTERGALVDRFWHRLMVPIRDQRGRPIAFAGRALRAEQQPKYVNSPTTPLFEKSRVLFGLDLARPAIRKSKEAIVVEGQFDAIAAHQAGVGNVVASMGTALTEPQFREVLRVTGRGGKAFIVLDNDPAGAKASETRGRDLRKLEEAIQVRTGGGVVGTTIGLDLFVAVLPPGMDPDELVRQDPDRFRAVVAQAKPVVEFLLDALGARHRLDTPAGRRDYLREALPQLAGLSDPITRALYLDRLAGATGVGQDVLEAELRAIRSGSRSGTAAAEAGKQRGTPERYVVAQLLRFPDQARRLELSPEDVSDPDLRSLFELVRSGERPDRYPEALAALRAELLTEVVEPASVDELVTALEQAALRVRERRLRRRLEEARAALAREPHHAGLVTTIADLVGDLARVTAALDRHTSLERATE